MEAAEVDDGELFLSAKEADRAALIGEVSAGRLRQRAAAERLGIGVRQRTARWNASNTSMATERDDGSSGTRTAR